MEQLIAHLFGDYIFQSDWMANSKTSQSVACIAHCLTYGIGFYIIGASWGALFVIIGTHFLIDRFRLAKYVVYAKQWICPFWIRIRQCSYVFENVMPKPVRCHSETWSNTNYCSHHINTEPHLLDELELPERKYVSTWEDSKATGYPSKTPPFMAVWLMIIADNTLHLLINYLAIKYF